MFDSSSVFQKLHLLKKRHGATAREIFIEKIAFKLVTIDAQLSSPAYVLLQILFFFYFLSLIALHYKVIILLRMVRLFLYCL